MKSVTIVSSMLLALTSAAAPFMNLTYGVNSTHHLAMRANFDDSPPQLELVACFPVNTWLGFGLGEGHMYNSELVFFMAPVDTNLHRVVSTRTTTGRSGRPRPIPDDSPIY